METQRYWLFMFPIHPIPYSDFLFVPAANPIPHFSVCLLGSRCVSRGYNVSKRREHEHDNTSQLYARVQSPGHLRGVNGSQERQRSLPPLPTEAESRREMEGPVSGRGGRGLRQGSPERSRPDPCG